MSVSARRSKVKTFFVLSALAAAALAVSPGKATAGGDTCQGQSATVPLIGDHYEGTPFADVIIVTEEGSSASGRGGDDLICVEVADRVRVYGEEGEDTIIVTDDHYTFFRAQLGEDDDTFTGGRGNDRVVTGSNPGTDTVSTGAGNDSALISVDGPTEHTIFLDLGAGDDFLEVLGKGVTPDSELDGGSGRDTLFLNSDREGTDVDFDAASHTIDRGGRIVSGWTSFEEYGVKEFDAKVTFTGTPGEDRFTAVAAAELDVDLGAGDDELVVDGSLGGATTGGPGRDRLISSHDIDLNGTVTDDTSYPGRILAISSFQDATSQHGTVRGNHLANDIVVGCGTVRGGAGNDRLREFTPVGLRYPHPDTCRDFVALGGPGDDVLIGSHGPDRLVGGPGRDTAWGRRGADVCPMVEVRHSC